MHFAYAGSQVCRHTVMRELASSLAEQGSATSIAKCYHAITSSTL